MKKILALISVVGFVLSLCACTAKNSPEIYDSTSDSTMQDAPIAEGDVAIPQSRPDESSDTVTEESKKDGTTADSEIGTEDAKYGPLFQKYVRDRVDDGEYTLRFKQSGLTMITTVSGKDSALESDAAGILHFTLINMDGDYHMVVHNTKRHAAITAEDYKKQAGTLVRTDMRFDDIRLTDSGEETIGGKRYSTETYDEGTRGVVTYYFDDTGLRRSRLVKDGQKSEFDTFEILDDADQSAFEIPKDYTEVSDLAALLA